MTILPTRITSFDHLALGSSAAPGDGTTSGNWQKASPDTTSVVNSRVRSGKKAARLVHNAGVDPINSSGERLEWADFRDSSTRERYGTEGWYGTGFYLDSFTPPNSWGIILQLHHAGGTGSPPFSLRVDRWGGDPGGSAGHMYLAYRDTPTGAERYRLVEPDIPVQTPVMVIFHIKWGGTAGSDYPGLIEMWTKTGNNAWVQQHPDGGWIGTTCYNESSASYWKGGWYSGAAQSVTLEHDGLYRGQSRADVEAWLGTSVTTPDPGPDPDPDPGPGPVTPPAPTVTVTSPSVNASLIDTISYSVNVSNPVANSTLYVGFAPSNTSNSHTISASGTVTGTLAIPDGAAAQQYFYASLHDNVGAKVAEQVFPITVSRTPAPEPTPITLTVNSPTASSSHVDTVDYNLTVTNAPEGAFVLVGFSTYGMTTSKTFVTGNATLTGTHTLVNRAPNGTYEMFFILADGVTEWARYLIPVNFTWTAPPTPDPDPEPPVDPRSEELAAALAQVASLTTERDLLAAKIAAAKAALG